MVAAKSHGEYTRSVQAEVVRLVGTVSLGGVMLMLLLSVQFELLEYLFEAASESLKDQWDAC